MTYYPYVGNVDLRMKTDGPKLLSDILSAPGGRWTQTKIAAAMKPAVSRQAVSYWADGTSRPDTDYQAQLEDLLRIPMRAWAKRGAVKKTGTNG